MAAWQKRAVWAGVAILCYLAGAALLLIVVIGTGVVGPDAGVAGPGGELPELTGTDVAMLVASVGLFVAGGYAMRRVRRDVTPDRSTLPSQFQHGPGTSRPNLDAAPDVSGEPPGADEVRCSNCGTVNEAAYQFCEQCSSELPE